MKALKCPGLWEWGGFAPLKSTHLISTSSLMSLVWDYHCRGIFSFGQMCIDHFQNCFLVCRTNTEHCSVTPCSLRKSQIVLGTTQTNRLKEKQAVYGATVEWRVAQHWHREITGDRQRSSKRNLVKPRILPKLKPLLFCSVGENWTKWFPGDLWPKVVLSGLRKKKESEQGFSSVLLFSENKKSAWTQIADIERRGMMLQASLKDDGLSNKSRSATALEASATGCKKGKFGGFFSV